MARKVEVSPRAESPGIEASELPDVGWPPDTRTASAHTMRRLAHALLALVLGALLVTLFRLVIAAESTPIAELLPTYAAVLASYLALVAVVGAVAAAILHRRRSSTDRMKQQLLNSVLGTPDAHGLDRMEPAKAGRG